MKTETPKEKIIRDIGLSLILYTLPVFAMLLTFRISSSYPWENALNNIPPAGEMPVFLEWLTPVFRNLSSWGLPLFVMALGIIELWFGLYDKKVWTRNERTLDIVCYILPKVIIAPVTVYFSLQVLPYLLPGMANIFNWIPFWWGFVIIAVADDLTQYWYHRLHHQIPFLWRFHRTHHSAPYMGMAMASRQNIIYTFFFSQIYLTATLAYLGLGIPALFVRVIKSLITTLAHSSIPWDKPLYRIRWLHPLAWLLERFISTPATHHAHHADTTDDGVGHYKGNFGNMFFIWDIIFGTGLISRQYPSSYGIKSYKKEEWYVQVFWPFLKSKVEGSALARENIKKKAVKENADTDNPIVITLSSFSEYDL